MIKKVILPGRMTGIREAVAANIRDNRRKLGMTQEQFAEKADVSTHYIAMIETCNTFPKPEMLERLAFALDIEPLQLFSAPSAPNAAFERLIQQGIASIEEAVVKTIQETLSGDCKD